MSKKAKIKYEKAKVKQCRRSGTVSVQRGNGRSTVSGLAATGVGMDTLSTDGRGGREEERIGGRKKGGGGG